jgi:predicted ATPase
MWFLGFPDQAGKASRQAVKLARRLGHPFSLAYALTFASILHCRLGDEKAAQALALETQELSRRHGYALWEIGASLALGWAQARQGCSAGVETIRQCAEATRVAMGGVTLVTLGPLADALVALGMFDEAHSVCEESFLAGSRIGDRHIMAELHRLKGEALLGMSTANERAAEDCFQTALSLSRRQQARSIELRSATSMARLWQRQGRVPEAKTLLEDVYHDFVEGFETSDLRSARKLLDGLNS